MPPLAKLLASDDAQTRKAAALLKDALAAPNEAAAVAVYVPGRVEFLGKHTDYAGGRSLLLAVDKGFRLLAVPRKDSLLRVCAGNRNNDVREFAFGQTPLHEPGHWVNYVATVARRVHMNFAAALKLCGADIAFLSDLPIAAGMSSSSALMVATFLGISAVNSLEKTALFQRHITDKVRLAEYLGCVENGQSYGSLSGEKGVGTFGGSEDHTAMLNCRADTLSQFSFAPSVFEREIPFPSDVAVLVASSGVEAIKTAAAMEQYNRASLRARKAAAAYNRATGANCRHLREIVLRVGQDGLAEALKAIRQGAAPDEQELDLPGRFEQFFREDQQIIPAVGEALLAGNVAALGALLDESHNLADRGLQNQIPQTRFLQQSARQLGALAATYFGAGFGGSVYTLVAKPRAGEFLSAWQKKYQTQFPDNARHSEFFATRPGNAATVEF